MNAGETLTEYVGRELRQVMRAQGDLPMISSGTMASALNRRLQELVSSGVIDSYDTVQGNTVLLRPKGRFQTVNVDEGSCPGDSVVNDGKYVGIIIAVDGQRGTLFCSGENTGHEYAVSVLVRTRVNREIVISISEGA